MATRVRPAAINLTANAERRVADLMAKAPAGLQVTMVRKGGHNIVATDDTILENGDAVLVVAEDNEAIATAAAWDATARRIDTVKDQRYGRRNPSRRTNVRR